MGASLAKSAVGGLWARAGAAIPIVSAAIHVFISPS